MIGDSLASFERGKTLFHGEAACFGCHGADGAGMPNLGPPLVSSEWVVGKPEILVGTSPTTLVVRRDVFLATGGFPTDPNAPEAAEWWIRFQTLLPLVAFVSDVVAERRLHGANTGTLRPAMRQDYVRLAKEALDRRRATSGGLP